MRNACRRPRPPPTFTLERLLPSVAQFLCVSCEQHFYHHCSPNWHGCGWGKGEATSGCREKELNTNTVIVLQLFFFQNTLANLISKRDKSSCHEHTMRTMSVLILLKNSFVVIPGMVGLDHEVLSGFSRCTSRDGICPGDHASQLPMQPQHLET